MNPWWCWSDCHGNKSLTGKVFMQNLRELSEILWLMLMKIMKISEETDTNGHFFFYHNVQIGPGLFQGNRNIEDFTTYFHSISLCNADRFSCLKIYLTFLQATHFQLWQCGSPWCDWLQSYWSIETMCLLLIERSLMLTVFTLSELKTALTDHTIQIVKSNVSDNFHLVKEMRIALN